MALRRITINIFYLSEDPVQCAQWMVDRHVVKMPLESIQILSTVHRVIDGLQVNLELEKNGKIRKKKVWVLDDYRNDILYNATHVNHPSVVWAMQSVENYNWLVDHTFALGEEYHYRYGKRHKSIVELGYTLQSPPMGLKEWDMTPMPSCMDSKYIISNNPIENYRNYYREGKKELHVWKGREPPNWI